MVLRNDVLKSGNKFSKGSPGGQTIIRALGTVVLWTVVFPGVTLAVVGAVLLVLFAIIAFVTISSGLQLLPRQLMEEPSTN